jgi:hypothetical protein
VQKELEKLTREVVASLKGWEFILDALSLAGLRKLVLHKTLCNRFGQPLMVMVCYHLYNGMLPLV